jgi:hypothetical protein
MMERKEKKKESSSTTLRLLIGRFVVVLLYSQSEKSHTLNSYSMFDAQLYSYKYLEKRVDLTS